MKRMEFVANVATVIAAASALAVAVVVVRRDSGPSSKIQQSGAMGASGITRVIPQWRNFTAGGHRMGALDVPVTILEFGDFECPACGSFAAAARKVLPHHATDVALVFRHWPLSYHRLAYPAARAAECAAQQGRFTQYHDELYSKQDSLGLISFEEFAQRAGVEDIDRFGRCERANQSVAAIDSGVAMARQIGARGTPTLLVNGVVLDAVPDSAQLEALIAEARKTK